MKSIQCPRCQSEEYIKSGVISGRQRFKCKDCGYNFTVLKKGKEIDQYYVVKALQLYIEGISYREIERILGVSHVSVINWVKQYKIERPAYAEYHPTYRVLNHAELVEFIRDKNNLFLSGCVITELGDKFMLIKWERFKKPL